MGDRLNDGMSCAWQKNITNVLSLSKRGGSGDVELRHLSFLLIEYRYGRREGMNFDAANGKKECTDTVKVKR